MHSVLFPSGWLRQHPELSGPITAALSHLVVGDMDIMSASSSSSKALTAKQVFVRSGGIEVVCRVSGVLLVIRLLTGDCQWYKRPCYRTICCG